MADVFLGVFIWMAACGAGLKGLKALRAVFDDSLEALTFASALGLGLLAYAVFILGSFKLLYPLPVAATVLFMFGFSFRELASGLWPFFLNKKPNTYVWFYAIPAVAVLVMSLAGVLAPPIGQDELCYHLAQPKNYVSAHAIYEVPYSSSALWPYLMEMFFTLGILLKGPGLAKFFHYALTLTAVSGIYCFTRRFAGPKAGFFAGLLFLLTPAVFVQSSFAYVDNGLACYSFLALYALFVYVGNRERVWTVIAGLCVGLALSVKLIGLFLLPIIGIVYLILFLRFKERRLEETKNFLLFLGMVFLSGGVWYVRSAILRGNPVFPFYPQFFGGNGWQISTYVDAHGRGGPLSFFMLLWDTAVHPEWFGGENIGFFYLAFLPLVFLIRSWPAFLKFTLGFGVAFTVLWFFIDPNIRFFFPALAFSAPAAGFVMAWLLETGSRAYRVLTHVIFIMIFVFHASFAVYHFKDAAALWFGGSDRHYAEDRDYSFAPAKIINQKLRPGSKLLSVGEVRAFNFDTTFVIEGELNRFTGYGKKFSSPADVMIFLRSEGFTHILYRKQPVSVGEDVFRLPVLLEKRAVDEHLEQLLIIRSGNERYVLYKIL